MNRYEAKIADILLKKYYKRKSIYKNSNVKRRIDLSVNKILEDYASYNVNLEEKELVNAAIQSLKAKGFITASSLKYSGDYEKIYFAENNAALFEEYAASELGITPRSFIVDDLRVITNGYKGKGRITDFYIDELENIMDNSLAQLDVAKAEDILKTLCFLEQNNEFLYLREASILIFGDSKYLENNRKAQVASVLSQYFINHGEEVFEDENLLERFNVYDTDQDICIKGPVLIEANGREVDIDGLTGGVSFSIKDIEKIKKISVHCKRVMTIENKTSFLRMNDACCYIYLGGFATKPQITFIKKLIKNNPEKEYMHFGDIDAGGFWIHKKLCKQAEHEFKLFHMSRLELENKDYKECLKGLTDSDRKRLLNLKDMKEYAACIQYMLRENVKLEQEIISLHISGVKEDCLGKLKM